MRTILLEKAQLCAYNITTRTPTGLPFIVLFNPDTYSITYRNAADIKRHNLLNANQTVDFTFTNREPSELSCELFFNTYSDWLPDVTQPDVRDTYQTLRSFMKVSSELHAPPILRFSWGSVAFIGVLSSMEENFTMFSRLGTPVRVRVRITMTGCTAEELTAVPLHSPDRTKVRMVSQNETVWAIAAREYGTPEAWRPIATANGIRNPRKLVQAQKVVIPSLPDTKEAAP